MSQTEYETVSFSINPAAKEVLPLHLGVESVHLQCQEVFVV